MQASLSPGVYIALLHQAATTGRIPLLTDDGRPTGDFQDLDAQQRIDTMKYLINKIVPDAPRIERHEVTSPDALEYEDYASLPTAELVRLVRFKDGVYSDSEAKAHA
jgi:hypothetical protein